MKLFSKFLKIGIALALLIICIWVGIHNNISGFLTFIFYVGLFFLMWYGILFLKERRIAGKKFIEETISTQQKWLESQQKIDRNLSE